MLPFLKHNKEASAAGPVETVKRESDEGPEYDMLEAAADDLIQAVQEGNPKAVAEALRAAFQICDSEPHEEGPHE